MAAGRVVKKTKNGKDFYFYQPLSFFFVCP